LLVRAILIVSNAGWLLGKFILSLCFSGLGEARSWESKNAALGRHYQEEKILLFTATPTGISRGAWDIVNRSGPLNVIIGIPPLGSLLHGYVPDKLFWPIL